MLSCAVDCIVNCFTQVRDVGLILAAQLSWELVFEYNRLIKYYSVSPNTGVIFL